jgi:hypothetical protein
MTLWGDFIYLDVEERRRFTSSKHEYLIEQSQIQRRVSIPASSLYANISLNFNHPLKEIVWVAQQDRMQTLKEWFNYGSRTYTEYPVVNTDIISTALLQLDGYDRFEKRSAAYFRLVQPWQYHTAIPNDFIYTYSFSFSIFRTESSYFLKMRNFKCKISINKIILILFFIRSLRI